MSAVRLTCLPCRYAAPRPEEPESCTAGFGRAGCDPNVLRFQPIEGQRPPEGIRFMAQPRRRTAEVAGESGEFHTGNRGDSADIGRARAMSYIRRNCMSWRGAD